MRGAWPRSTRADLLGGPLAAAPPAAASFGARRSAAAPAHSWQPRSLHGHKQGPAPTCSSRRSCSMRLRPERCVGGAPQ
jgi:hypothetical protein